jgi:hypothetical protein
VLATNEMLAKVHAMPKMHMTGKEFISVQYQKQEGACN